MISREKIAPQKDVMPASLKLFSIFSTASGQYARAMDNNARASPSLHSNVMKNSASRLVVNPELEFELSFRLRGAPTDK